MAVVFTDVTKCKAVQRNHFRSNMAKYIITSLFGGNKVMVQKNRMKEQRTTDPNQEIEEREWFKNYTLVHLVQVPYTCRLMGQKKRIRMHALSQKEKCVWDGKSRFWSKVLVRDFGPRYSVQGFGPRYSVRGIWSKVLVRGFGLRFWSKVFDPRYWSEVFGPRYWFEVLGRVFGPRYLV